MKLKTNMTMDVSLLGHTVTVEHKTGLVDATALVKIGNTIRAKRGQNTPDVRQLGRMTAVEEFVAAVQKQIDAGHYHYFDTPAELLFATGKGRAAKTKAFLPVALKLAAMMDADFEAEVYRVFIEEKILHYRDESGEQFKALNIVIDSFLPGRENSDSNKGVYIAVAKLMREVVLPGVVWDTKSQGNIWNSELATGDVLRRRDQLEAYLARILRDGFIKDFEHLKQIIEAQRGQL